jgi:hypothetical protein
LLRLLTSQQVGLSLRLASLGDGQVAECTPDERGLPGSYSDKLQGCSPSLIVDRGVASQATDVTGREMLGVFVSGLLNCRTHAFAAPVLLKVERFGMGDLRIIAHGADPLPCR